MSSQPDNKDSSFVSDIPRIFIVDPQQLTDNFRFTDTKSKLVRVVVVLKKFSEKWFSHVLLLAFLMLYACIGAAIFQYVESPYEAKRKNHINKMRTLLIEKMWHQLNKSRLYGSEDDWKDEARPPLSLFAEEVCKAFDEGIISNSEETKWTFIGGLIFSMTVFTTIGYGDNPPRTTAGKAITIFYSVIGIPILLMVLADFGKLFTRGIKFALQFFQKLYYARSLRKVRKVGRMPTKILLKRGFAIVPPDAKSKNDETDKNRQQLPANVYRANVPAYWYAARPDLTLSRPLSGINAPQFRLTQPTPPATALPTSSPETPMPDLTFEVNDEFNLPVSLALGLLLLYLFLGAIIFWVTEDEQHWSLFQAFYFVFISMSTIGFGDFVPQEKSMIYAFIYLLFGLALTSMCINVIQEKLSSTFQKAKMLVGETIGLDVEQMMQQELAEEKSAHSSKEGSVDTLDSERSSKKSKPKTVDDNSESKKKKSKITDNNEDNSSEKTKTKPKQKQEAVKNGESAK